MSHAIEMEEVHGKQDEDEPLLDETEEDVEFPPKPKELPSMRKKHPCCYTYWTSPMPCHINFPMSIFLMLVVIFLAVFTIFISLAFNGYGPYVIANAPVWTWAAWVVINIFMFFTLWGILFSIRHLLVRNSYSSFKVTFAMYGMWAPLLTMLFAICNFPLLQFLVNYNVHPDVKFWLSRVIWTVFVFGVFWLLHQLLCRYFIIRIERDRLWKRMARTLWGEELMRQMLVAAKHKAAGDKSFVAKMADQSMTRLSRGVSAEAASIEEYEYFSGKVLDNSSYNIDVPSVLLADTREAERQARLCRLAVSTSHKIFTNFGAESAQRLAQSDLVDVFGEEGALEHTSLWDNDHDGIISRADMVHVLLDIFQEREYLKLMIENRTPLARLLATVLGLVLGILLLIIVLLIYEINAGDLLLPVLTFVLPLAFIFGRTFQVLFESFIVMFVIQPWTAGDLITHAGQTLVVEEMTLYVSTGHNANGLWISVPNAPAISGAVVNYGRSVPSRVRVYIKIATKGPMTVTAQKSALMELRNRMQAYCDRHAGVFAQNAFSCWAEHNGSGEFDDIRAMYFCFNAGLTKLREVDFGDMRVAKERFIHHLRRCVEELSLKGLGASGMTVLLDASSVLPPDYKGTVDL